MLLSEGISLSHDLAQHHRPGIAVICMELEHINQACG